MMEHLIFAGKVILVIAVVSQIAPLHAMINRNYFAA